jgi:hypothetical protein
MFDITLHSDNFQKPEDLLMARGEAEIVRKKSAT